MKNPLSDMRSILSVPNVYRLFSNIMGTTGTKSYLVQTFIRPRKGDRILDIGCGTAGIIDFLPDVEYIGFDMSQTYIDSAIKRYGNRGTFFCKKVSTNITEEFSTSFDIVLAKGVLHHLNDEEATELFRLAQSLLKPTGRLVTMDGCYVEGQSPTARYLLSKDRGKFVRTKEAYERLARIVFPRIKLSIHHDLLRIPYTHIIGEYSLS